ncbi:MAG TPA: recombination protein O N-terminal domain-containing protein [Flavobacteriales bacterium]|nr:recombination protein O N-terminal domain-containing protein [Flavobacteriales bacterium]
MLTTAYAVVLKTVKHGDRTVILKAWTQHAGARSYVVRIGSKKGNSAAALQALNRLELVVDERDNNDLHAVRELRIAKPFTRIHAEPVRGATALFVQEVLHRVLRMESAEPALDAFVSETLEVLDTVPDLRCFPLVFLIQLSGHLGFFPEHPAEGEDHFDMQEGCFYPPGVLHGHTLAPPLSHAFIKLLDIDYHTMGDLSLTASTRRDLLDHLLLYFRLHVEGLGELRSPAVLREALG